MQSTYFLDYSDIPLTEYTNIFTANLFWITRGVHDSIATYDLVVRDIPDRWSFYIFDGLERFIDILQHYRFDEEALELLRAMGFITDDATESFYRNFKFSGDVYAMRDGTVFFPGEPIVRITAPLCEANVLTAFALNAFGYPIRLLTKSVRVKMAAQGKLIITGAAVRLPSLEAAIWSARANHLIGSIAVNPLFYKKFGHKDSIVNKVVANINHAVIKSFDSELEAFEYVLDSVADKAELVSVMVDTYDFHKGLACFISEFKKRPSLKQNRFYVSIDSGDIKQLAFSSRKILDDAGLSQLGIMGYSNLDEYSIADCVKENVPIDIYVSITETGNITDAPKLECVYKSALLEKPDGSLEHKAKLTPGKESYPGKKQVFRTLQDGTLAGDIIGLDNEALGEPLLQAWIRGGEQVAALPSLSETKEYLAGQLETLPGELTQVQKTEPYSVLPSAKLSELLEKVKQKHG